MTMYLNMLFVQYLGGVILNQRLNIVRMKNYLCLSRVGDFIKTNDLLVAVYHLTDTNNIVMHAIDIITTMGRSIENSESLKCFVSFDYIIERASIAFDAQWSHKFIIS